MAEKNIFQSFSFTCQTINIKLRVKYWMIPDGPPEAPPQTKLPPEGRNIPPAAPSTPPGQKINYFL